MAMPKSVLIVEDDAVLARILMGYFSESGVAVQCCTRVADARAVLTTQRPDLLVADVRLPDGTALDILTLGEGFVGQVTIAISAQAEPKEAFALARAGVHTFLQKPFTLDALDEAVAIALEASIDVGPQVRASVGAVDMRQMERQCREAMMDEALRRSRGSKRSAARLLGVSRQFLQHALKAITP